MCLKKKLGGQQLFLWCLYYKSSIPATLNLCNLLLYILQIGIKSGMSVTIIYTIPIYIIDLLYTSII